MQSFIELEWGDGLYTFKLGLAQINELQIKCGVGIGGLYARLIRGRMIDNLAISHPAAAEYRYEDVVEVIRQGLIGGKSGTVDGETVEITTQRANQLVDAYVIGQPIAANWAVAAAIMMALIEGYDPPKKAEPEQPAPATKKAGSTTRKRSTPAE